MTVVKPAGSRLETVTNVLLIVASLAVLGTLSARYFSDNNLPAPAGPGRRINVPVDWHAAKKTLLLVMSKDCQYCSASLPFYRTLVASRPEDVNMVAVFPSDLAGGTDYLRSNSIPDLPAIQADFATAGLTVTPTLVVADANGIVERLWLGKLGPEQEEEVRDSLRIESVTSEASKGGSQ